METNTMTKGKNQQTTLDGSRTNVNFGLWGGARKVVGIRCDITLYNAFKPVARRVFGSVCRPIESFMASVVGLDREGDVNFGNTFEVGKIVIERNLRSRRKLVVETKKTLETETEVTHTVGCSWCHRPAVVVLGKVGFPQRREYACEYHVEEMKSQPMWELLGPVGEEGS